jgi:branched-chain amino acid transport system permease protein
VITAASELLRHVENGTTIGPLHVAPRPGLADVGLALILLLILTLRRAGIVGGREITWPFSRLWRPAHPEAGFEDQAAEAA